LTQVALAGPPGPTVPSAIQVADGNKVSIGWGLLAFFGLPILRSSLGHDRRHSTRSRPPCRVRVIYAIGYSATAWIVGRRILCEPTAWILAFLAGRAILRVLALVPILGDLVDWAAIVLGLGSLIVAIWRARPTSHPVPATA
jgi:hypothetical protein